MKDNNKTIAIFKALADPIRIKIIKYLKNANKELTCGEIGNVLKISKTSGSYHFKILEAANLITTRKESREKYVKLNIETINYYVTDFFDSL